MTIITTANKKPLSASTTTTMDDISSASTASMSQSGDDDHNNNNGVVMGSSSSGRRRRTRRGGRRPSPKTVTAAVVKPTKRTKKTEIGLNLGRDEETGHWIVTSIVPGSLLDRDGTLKAGMRILEINGVILETDTTPRVAFAAIDKDKRRVVVLAQQQQQQKFKELEKESQQLPPTAVAITPPSQPTPCPIVQKESLERRYQKRGHHGRRSNRNHKTNNSVSIGHSIIEALSLGFSLA